MALHRRFFRGGEVNRALGFVYRVYARHFPVALGDLRKLFAAAVVEIKMTVAGTFAGPQETAGFFEEIKIVADVDPVLVLLSDQR
jgi:hypothetical protein